MTMKKILLLIVCVWAILHIVYKYTGYSLQDLLPPQEVSVRTLTAKEKAAFTKPIKIEDKIYENTPDSLSIWARPLYADKKTILLVNWQNKHGQLVKDFKNLFRLRGYDKFYRKQLYIIHSNWMSWQYDTSKELFLTQCDKQAACIINPRTHEMAILPKADIDHLAYFLEKYKDW